MMPPSSPSMRLPRSEQRQLARIARWSELRSIQRRRAVLVEPESFARELEAARQQRGDRPGAAHARAEVGIVVAAAAYLLDQAHHMSGAQRVVLREPIAKQVLDLVRQPQHRPARPARTVRGGCFQDRLEVTVIELW